MKHILPFLFCLLFSHSFAQSGQDSSAYSEQGIHNLVVFSKMYGALRYFYPSEKLSKIDWKKFLETAIPKVTRAKDENELIREINASCGSKDVFVASDDINHLHKSINGSGKIRYWSRYGYSGDSDWITNGFFGFLYKLFGPYHSKIVSDTKKVQYPDPDSFYSYPVSSGIALHMRHALYKNGNLPEEYISISKKFKKEKSNESTNESTTFRAATAIYITEILRNFFPYPEFVSGDWDSLLSNVLKCAFSDSSNQQFLSSLRVLLSALNDGHAGVLYNNDSLVFKPPLSFVLIDSSIVVKNCEQCDSLGVKIGDMLLKVNGEDALQVLKREERIWSAATAWDKTYTALSNSFLSGIKNSTVNLDFSGEQGLKELQIRRTHLYVKVKPASNGLADEATIDSNIVYLRLAGVKYKTVKKALSGITTEKGIIFDNRGYPNQSPFFLSKLAKAEKMESQKWLVPVFKFPFQQQMEYDTSNWRIPKAKKPIPDSCKVVFLTNYKAISASETLMSIVKYYKVGTIIGETTAGTNGNIVATDFNKTFKFIFTGMKVLNQDGSQFHGIGVVPDIEVKPTIKGIREGRDEVLEYAIEYIKSGK